MGSQRIRVWICMVSACFLLGGCGGRNTQATKEEAQSTPTMETAESQQTDEFIKSPESKDFFTNIRVEQHPILSGTVFFSVMLNELEEADEGNWEVSYSEKTPKGHLRFDKGEGIIYATGEPDRQSEPQERNLMGVLLTDDRYRITGGIKTGMKETELEEVGLSWESWNPDAPEAFTAAMKSGQFFDFDKVLYAKGEADGEWNRSRVCVEAYLKEGTVAAVALRLDTDTFYQFSVRDLFVTGHKILENQLFNFTEFKDIRKAEVGALHKSSTDDIGNGHFNFYEGQGIIYVVFSNGEEKEYDYPHHIILTDKKYAFGCGLRVGMTEEEIKKLEIPFRVYEKSALGKELVTNFLCQGKGPIAELDYDTIYFYEATIFDKEVKEFQYSMTTSIGIVAFLKQGKVVAACTDFPTAG